MNEDKSARYHRLKRRAGLASAATTIVVLGGLLFTGASTAAAAAARAVAPAPLASTALYVLGLAAVIELAGFPLAFYRNYILERRYGLFSGTFGGWIRDYLKALALGLVVGTAGVEAIYVLLARFPSSWWLLSAALFVFAIALMANLAPTLLLPMFYKFRPLEHESLRSRLVALSTRAGVPGTRRLRVGNGGEDTAGECRARGHGQDATHHPLGHAACGVFGGGDRGGHGARARRTTCTGTSEPPWWSNRCWCWRRFLCGVGPEPVVADPGADVPGGYRGPAAVAARGWRDHAGRDACSCTAFPGATNGVPTDSRSP